MSTRGKRWLAGALATVFGLSGACNQDKPPATPPAPIEILSGPPGAVPAQVDPDGGADTEFVHESFDQIYPVFLLRKLAAGPKANLWRTRYRGKWIRWTGVLVSVTPNGATFRQIPASVTFDVSVMLDAAGRAKLRRFPPGSTITYIGRLEHYDDVFRTFYLTHGDIAEKK